MNHVYRLVWSHRRNGWVAVSELARGRKKGSARRLTIAALSLTAAVAQAGPNGGQIVSGAGQIRNSGNTTTVTQSSQNLSLDWQSFDIAPQETVDFVQPSASAVAVNHILGNNATQILGHLNANGQVYLINPNGILFGAGSRVNVGGLVASTLEPTATSGRGTRSFSGHGTGSVTNEGTITAADGGYVVLLGNRVNNLGTIVARMGTVGFGAGSAATLTFSGDTLVGMQVDRSTLNNLAENGGLIHADGGRVIMTAGAQNALLATVVNNTGVIEARTVEDHGGTITLLGGKTAGQVNVGGTLDAGAPNGGDGGAIETSAAHVSVADGAAITTAAPKGLTGSWMVDPQDFTVAASGGDITGSTLSAELATTNVQLESSSGATAGSGNVNVNDSVNWSANTTLKLTASNNVNVNADIAATGASAGLVIAPNTTNGSEAASGTGVYALNNGSRITLSGANPSLSIAGHAYTVINSLGAAGSTTGTDLQGIEGNLAGYYALGSNIDASSTASWNDGDGFKPLGQTSSFSGTFDGLGHTISGLTIVTSPPNGSGMFGTSEGTIRNVGLVNESMTGGPYRSGGLVGENGGVINRAYVTGHVTAGNYTGGVAGTNWDTGTITDSYSAATVHGAGNVGGLVGGNYGTITDSYATGAVSGTFRSGGLAGFSMEEGAISNSYATGAVVGTSAVGGLLGANYGAVRDSHATGTVTGSAGSFGVGGLIGSNFHAVSGSYATGTVNGTTSVGGLVGFNYGRNGATTVTNSYATGAVGGTSYVGGLVGYNYAGGYGSSSAAATIGNSYATGSVSGSSEVGGLVGYNYAGSSGSYGTPGTFVATVNDSYATGSVSGSTNVGGLVGNSYAGAPTDSATVSNSFWNVTSTGQPTSSGGGTGLTSAQMQQQGSFAGWDFTGTWIVYDGHTNPLLRSYMTPLTVTASDATETYNGVPYATGNGATYSVAPGESLLGSLTYGGSARGAVNVGTYTLTPEGLYSNQQGYIISYGSGTLTITPAPLTVSGTTASNKVYDGTTTATLRGGTLLGVIGSDSVALTQAGAFASANAGTGIAVTASDALSGSGAGNYTLIQPTGLSADITPAPLTVIGTDVANKIYDGTTTAALAGGTLSGVIGSDSVALAQAGAFASANAGTGIAVTASDALSGSGAGNYTLIQPTGLSADISPATLTYVALPASTRSGKLPSDLLGTVRGFAPGDTLANATSGALVWTTDATAASPPGSYSIDGGGLTSRNYVFSQAEDNATALTVVSSPATPPSVAGLESSMLVVPAGSSSLAFGSSQNSVAPESAAASASTPTQGNSTLGSDNSAAGGSSSGYSGGPFEETADFGGGKLYIENGGVRLPDDSSGAH